MKDLSPSVIVLGGPNGAGKTTAAPTLLQGKLAVAEFVNADAIALGLSSFNPEGVAIAAGRIMLNRIDELSRSRISFAFESTLAGQSLALRLCKLKQEGYQFHLVFLWLPSADMAVARVADRVRMGGHSVPEDAVRRRYQAGLVNFFDKYRPLATTWRMYDNSQGEGMRLIADGRGRVERVQLRDVWEQIRQGLSG